ncbi:DUF6615 family protein [Rhizobium laguerreae]|uniref:Uncharacterized protein n=1 Tax=Rhizobium laguerreae TaxID=1076926 RepID=A0A6N9ZBS8_9HYPH|nr:DUF6615 family protein [Rhizobium laguerreae]NEH90280.1 hypothetical protein [Rhizobium laguerreae]
MLCQFANTFPGFVSKFLAKGHTLKRRFREETVTDLLMGSLITAAGGRLVVEFPNEPVTGADMEWNFVDLRSRVFFRILLQAKQAYGGGDLWSRHAYRELYHASGTGSKLQAVTLCDTARTTPATYPLYIFYNAETTIALARSKGVRNLAGVNLADGYEVERLVLAAKGRTLRTRNRSVGTIWPLLEPLSSLFCPPSVYPMPPMSYSGDTMSFVISRDEDGRPVAGTPLPPDPITVRERIVSIAEASRNQSGSRQTVSKVSRVPEVSHSIPEDIQEVIERRRIPYSSSQPLDRWRLTFVSARHSDDGDAI